MVDSNDRDRVVEARDELHRMLNEVYGKNLLLLILYIFENNCLWNHLTIMTEQCVEMFC